MKFNKRIYRCLWRDKVDLGMWLVIMGFFLGFAIWKANVSGVLAVVALYVYGAMYRLNHFWQDRQKMYNRLKELGENVGEILEQEDL